MSIVKPQFAGILAGSLLGQVFVEERSEKVAFIFHESCIYAQT